MRYKYFAAAIQKVRLPNQRDPKRKRNTRKTRSVKRNVATIPIVTMRAIAIQSLGEENATTLIATTAIESRNRGARRNAAATPIATTVVIRRSEGNTKGNTRSTRSIAAILHPIQTATESRRSPTALGNNPKRLPRDQSIISSFHLKSTQLLASITPDAFYAFYCVFSSSLNNGISF